MEKIKSSLNTFSTMYRESHKFKIATVLTTLLLSFIITIFLETFYFNGGRFNGNRLDVKDIEVEYSGFKENADGTYTPQSSEAIIFFRFPRAYVHKVTFYGYADSSKPVSYELACLDSYPPPYVDFYNTFSNSKETYVVDAVAEEFTIFIMNAEGVPMRIELDELDYTFNNNPVRMGATFVITLLLFYLLFCFVGAFDFKIENIALVLILGFGILYAYLVPIRYNYDEYAHLVRATNVASGNLESQPGEEIGYPNGLETASRMDYRSYDDFREYYDYFQKKKGFEDEVDNIPTGADSYLFIPYIFSAAGVLTSRLLGLSVYYIGVFSKLFNVFFYALMIYFSVKIIPSNKPLVFFLAATPIMLSAATTAGITGVQNGCFILGISYLAYLLVEKKRYGWKEYGVLLILFGVVTICKMTFGFFMLLLLLLKSADFDNTTLKRFNKVVTILIMVALMGYVYVYSNSIGIDLLKVSGVDFKAQLGLAISDPGRIIYRLWKYTTTVYLNGNMLQDLGYIVYVGRISGLYTLIGAILLIVLSFAGDEKALAYDNWQGRSLLWICFILSIAATEAALYLTFTPVNSRSLDGFQSRYVYSILLAPLLSFESRHLYLHYNKRGMEITTSLYVWLLLMMTIGTLVVKYYK